MTVNRWRGDAPSVAKILTFIAPNNTDVAVVVTVGNKTIEFDEWNAGAIASGLTGAGFAELASITVETSGDNVTLTGPVDTDFDAGISIAPTVSVEYTTKGRAAVNQQTRLTFAGATGGSFTLTCNDETTAAINLLSSGSLNTAGVSTAIDALSSFAAADVSVSAVKGAILITWQGAYAGVPVAVTMDARNLDNGGTIEIVEVQPARLATRDVYAMTTVEDLQFTISDGTTGVSIKSNETDAAISTKLSEAWGGEVVVYSGTTAGVGIILTRHYVIDLVGFPGVSKTLSITADLPDVDIDNALVQLGKVVDSTDTTPSEVLLVDTVSGALNISIGGVALEWTTRTGFIDAINEARQFHAWSVFNPSLTAHGTDSPVAWGTDDFFLIAFDSDTLTTTTSQGGEDLPDTALTATGDGRLIKIQDGGTTNAASAAVHSIAIKYTGTAGTIGGTYQLSFDEGDTGDIDYNESAATLKTLIESAVGFTVAVTGTGTASDPYFVTYTAYSSSRNLPTVAEQKLTGDGSGSASVYRDSVAGRSAVTTVTVSSNADGGHYFLTIPGNQSVRFEYNDSAAAFLANLQEFPALAGALDVVVTRDSIANAYTITYADDLANTPGPGLSVPANGNFLTDSSNSDTLRAITQYPTGPGNFAEPLNWSLGHVPDAGEEITIDDPQGPITYGLRQFVAVTADASTDTLTAAGGFDLVAGQVVNFLFGSVAIGGLSQGTDYYVASVDHVAGTFKVSATEYGLPVDITSAGTGPHYCGVIASDVAIPASFTEQIGLPERNDDGYVEYLERFLCLGIDADGEIVIGDGDGSGSGLLRIDTGNSNGQIRAISTSQSSVRGVPPLLVGALSEYVSLLITGGDVGVAVYDDETALLGSFRVVTGSLQIGSATIAGNAISASGLLTAKRISVSGLVQIT